MGFSLLLLRSVRGGLGDGDVMFRFFGGWRSMHCPAPEERGLFGVILWSKNVKKSPYSSFSHSSSPAVFISHSLTSSGAIHAVPSSYRARATRLLFTCTHHRAEDLGFVRRRDSTRLLLILKKHLRNRSSTTARSKFPILASAGHQSAQSVLQIPL
jgi:hypothetical protein